MFRPLGLYYNCTADQPLCFVRCEGLKPALYASYLAEFELSLGVISALTCYKDLFRQLKTIDSFSLKVRSKTGES